MCKFKPGSGAQVSLRKKSLKWIIHHCVPGGVLGTEQPKSLLSQSFHSRRGQAINKGPADENYKDNRSQEGWAGRGGRVARAGWLEGFPGSGRD